MNFKRDLLFVSITCLILIISHGRASAQARITQSINTGWKFYKGAANVSTNTAAWEAVTIPHSWNTQDVNDEIPGYYRGPGWYFKKIFIPSDWSGKKVYLEFEGVNQYTEVYVNGEKAGSHVGGYSTFHLDITKLVKYERGGINELRIKVDNSYNDDIPPLTADFTFFGGIYRDIYLSAINSTHFSMDNYGSKGVFISTPEVSEKKAQVKVRGSLTGGSTRTVIITTTIKDQQGRFIAEQQSEVKAGKAAAFEHNFSSIANPTLWSIEKPHLYSVTSTIKDAKTGITLDGLVQPLGFRWFKFDPDKGFFLNGKPVKLVGASRHQDFKDMGNALPDAMQVRDVKLLKEMGGNFLRIAHYPQDKSVLEACDRLGILTSVEIPIVNTITESEAFSDNSRNMQIEMIRQNFNHPSIVIWAYMNEVLLKPRFSDDKSRQELYFKSVARLAQELEDITRKEDPYRYTMIPNHGNFQLYHRVGLTKIPMLVGWNLYQGWYGGELSGFAEYLDMHHKELPDKPLLVTEYGSDADIRIHCDEPERFDKSVEYTLLYHQTYLKAMMDRPFVAAAIAWNLADFSSETRRETDPHTNNKGILTIDRTPKDTYYFYQANLIKRPFVKIGSAEQVIRSGIAGPDHTLIQQIPVYSNQSSVALSVNGIDYGKQATTLGYAVFKVALTNGLNSVEARTFQNDTTYRDQLYLKAAVIPNHLKNSTPLFEEINVNLGDKRYFFDAKSQQVWLPEKEYTEGSWGFIGGKPFRLTDQARQKLGSDIDVLGTELDPVYQTQRVGIEGFRFDVPDGSYELTFHFAELLSDKEKEVLVYNLSSNHTGKQQFKERSFDVSVNGNTIISALGSTNYLIPEQAYSIKTPVNAVKGQGVHIKFSPLSEASILNGIQLKRIY